MDPGGGVWYYAYGQSELLRLDEYNGQLLQTINVDTLIPDTGTYIPASCMTIAGDDTAPIMIVSATTSSYSRTYVAAIDLRSGSLVWSFRVDQGTGTNGVPMGQFPIVINSANKPVVVFSTYGNGVWALTSN